MSGLDRISKIVSDVTDVYAQMLYDSFLDNRDYTKGEILSALRDLNYSLEGKEAFDGVDWLVKEVNRKAPSDIPIIRVLRVILIEMKHTKASLFANEIRTLFKTSTGVYNLVEKGVERFGIIQLTDDQLDQLDTFLTDNNLIEVFVRDLGKRGEYKNLVDKIASTMTEIKEKDSLMYTYNSSRILSRGKEKNLIRR